jgi:hypothetical protein
MLPAAIGTGGVTGMRSNKSWIPTNKWFATQVTAIAALLVAWVNAGDWNKTLTIALIGLVSQAIVGYLVPNVNAPGGVPVQRTERQPVAAWINRPGLPGPVTYQ